jgi:hypothetical protein
LIAKTAIPRTKSPTIIKIHKQTEIIKLTTAKSLTKTTISTPTKVTLTCHVANNKILIEKVFIIGNKKSENHLLITKATLNNSQVKLLRLINTAANKTQHH